MKTIPTAIVFSHKQSPRLGYISKWIFEEQFGFKVHNTSNLQEYQQAAVDIKINYSDHILKADFTFSPVDLLFEAGIDYLQPIVEFYYNQPVFFTSKEHNAYPFDLFAASFWLLSRYEEYPSQKKDVHNRYLAVDSLAYKNGFLKTPIIDVWLEEFKIQILSLKPQLKFKAKKFRHESTIDVDSAYAFLEKGMMRSTGAFFKDIFNADWRQLAYRINVILGRKSDPFDTYESILKCHKADYSRPIFFFLLGDYGVNDKNVPPNSRRLNQLIKHLGDYATIGLHPSYASFGDYDKLAVEVNRLAEITHSDVKHSRQHFLMLKFPETYRGLLELEIENDYTMGYATHSGFRASTSESFLFFDLLSNKETHLRIHPFCFMEATYKYYGSNSVEEAYENATELIGKLKDLNGKFSSLWHNDSISNYKPWEGWQNLYAMVCNAAK